MRGKINVSLIQKKLPLEILVILNLLIVFLIIILLSSNLGAVNDSLSRIFVVLLIISMISLNLPLRNIYSITKSRKNLNFKCILIGIIFFILYLILFQFSRSTFIQITSISILLSAMYIFLIGLNIKRSELFILSITTFSYSVFFIILNTISETWSFFQKFSFL